MCRSGKKEYFVGLYNLDMIKGIVFDLDGVYFVNGKENFIKAVTEVGVTEDEIKRVFLRSDEMNRLYKTGKWGDWEYWGWAEKELGLTTPTDLRELLIKGYEVNTPVVELIKKVRNEGYKTLICSNNFPARINGLQERFKFLEDFDTVCLSYEVGETKPSKMIFRELIEKSGLEASEIAYADDNEDNVEVAKNMGIKAFMYRDFEGFMNDLRQEGVKI